MSNSTHNKALPHIFILTKQKGRIFKNKPVFSNCKPATVYLETQPAAKESSVEKFVHLLTRPTCCASGLCSVTTGHRFLPGWSFQLSTLGWTFVTLCTCTWAGRGLWSCTGRAVFIVSACFNPSSGPSLIKLST